MTEAKDGAKKKESKALEWKTCARGHQYKGASDCPICRKSNQPRNRHSPANTLGLKR